MTGLEAKNNGAINGGTSETLTIFSSRWKSFVLEVVVVILLLYLFAIIIKTIIDHAYLLTLILIFVDLVIVNIANRFIWS